MIGPCLQIELNMRLELREADAPPDAAKGIEGLRMANLVLEDFGACGLLIGSVAKHLWLGVDDVGGLEDHSDIDVVVLSSSCQCHPGQWEEGIDWWVRHSILEAHTNGTGYLLKYLFSFEPPGPMRPGLYLCPRELVTHSVRMAKSVWGNRLAVCCRDFLLRPDFREFPVMPLDCLRISWFDPWRHRQATHCQPA